MPPEPTTPAEKFASLLTGLGQAVAAMSGGDRLSYFLIGLIIERIRPIKQAFARLVAGLVAGLAAGTFAPPPLYPAPQARPAPTTGRKSARTEIRLVEAAAAGHQRVSRPTRKFTPRPGDGGADRHRARHTVPPDPLRLLDAGAPPAAAPENAAPGQADTPAATQENEKKSGERRAPGARHQASQTSGPRIPSQRRSCPGHPRPEPGLRLMAAACPMSSIYETN